MTTRQFSEEQGLGKKECVEPPGQVWCEPEIVRRIDAMIRELQLLREMVATRQPEKNEINLVDELFGALGNGSWAEYDSCLDWARFNK